MVDILQSEGHQINDRELIRLRLRLKLLLRERVSRPRKDQNADWENPVELEHESWRQFEDREACCRSALEGRKRLQTRQASQ